MPVVNPAFQTAIEPHFEKALVRASRNIQAAIPHNRLAIQIDLALEFAWLHGAWFDFWTPQSRVDYIGEPKLDRLIQRVVTVAESVEDDVELGFHLCYGSFVSENLGRDTSLVCLLMVFRRCSKTALRATSRHEHARWCSSRSHRCGSEDCHLAAHSRAEK
jgi:hypothetical protein